MSSRLKTLDVALHGTQPTIRRLATNEDLLACAAVQREVWGEDFSDCVPPALLKVVQEVGGVAAGAFDKDGRLLGFVFGITGARHGRAVHWSHMLAVRPEARGEGIGRALKDYQRRLVSEIGVETIEWSFDPLVARNAHLNLNRLGAEISEYVESMYPPMGSKLHGNIPIDRVVVSWSTAAVDVPLAMDITGRTGGDSLILDWREEGTCGPEALAYRLRDATSALLLIPEDFEAMLQQSPERAYQGRVKTRAYFQACLRHGLRVDGFSRGAGSIPYYILAQRT